MTTLAALQRRLTHGQTVILTGGGRDRAAAQLAASWLCATPQRPSGAPCGQCASCLLAPPQPHPDLAWLPPQPPGLDDAAAIEAWRTTRPVEAGRQHRMSLVAWVQQRVSTPPRGPGRGHRVLWLADWDRQGDGAPQQALLKLAEEPPPDLLVLATATTLSRLPRTWRSRALWCHVPAAAASPPAAPEPDPLVTAFLAAGTSARAWSTCLQQVGHRPTTSPLDTLLPALMAAVGAQTTADARRRQATIRDLAGVERLMRQQLHPQLLAHQVLQALARLSE